MSTTSVILASGEADSALTIGTWVLVVVTGMSVMLDNHVIHALTVMHHAHMSVWHAVSQVAQNIVGCIRCGLTIRRNFHDYPIFGYAVPFRA